MPDNTNTFVETALQERFDAFKKRVTSVEGQLQQKRLKLAEESLSGTERDSIKPVERYVADESGYEPDDEYEEEQEEGPKEKSFDDDDFSVRDDGRGAWMAESGDEYIDKSYGLERFAESPYKERDFTTEEMTNNEMVLANFKLVKTAQRLISDNVDLLYNHAVTVLEINGFEEQLNEVRALYSKIQKGNVNEDDLKRDLDLVDRNLRNAFLNDILQRNLQNMPNSEPTLVKMIGDLQKDLAKGDFDNDAVIDRIQNIRKELNNANVNSYDRDDFDGIVEEIEEGFKKYCSLYDSITSSFISARTIHDIAAKSVNRISKALSRMDRNSKDGLLDVLHSPESQQYNDDDLLFFESLWVAVENSNKEGEQNAEQMARISSIIFRDFGLVESSVGTTQEMSFDELQGGGLDSAVRQPEERNISENMKSDDIGSIDSGLLEVSEKFFEENEDVAREMVHSYIKENPYLDRLAEEIPYNKPKIPIDVGGSTDSDNIVKSDQIKTQISSTAKKDEGRNKIK